LVADAVAFEPVSILKFPANREFCLQKPKPAPDEVFSTRRHPRPAPGG
jgi:hypothetical protein